MKPSAIINTPAFKAWFEGSRVLDAQEQPLMLYHSTKSAFTSFQRTTDIGFHFGTKDQAVQRSRVMGNDQILPFYLRLENPLELPDLGDWDFCRFAFDGLPQATYIDADGHIQQAFDDETIDQLCEALSELAPEADPWEWFRRYFERRGFDGIRYRNIGESPDEQPGDYSYIAFRPHQIKLANGMNRHFRREACEFTM